MQKNAMWLPIIASVGIGAATYYSMTKNNQSMGQTIQKALPFVTSVSSGGGGGNTGKLGPFGMA